MFTGGIAKPVHTSINKATSYLAIPPCERAILVAGDQPNLLPFFLCFSAVVDYHCVARANILHLLHNKDQ